MIDPSRLLASAARLWPDTLHSYSAKLCRAQGKFRASSRWRDADAGTRKLEVAYTPGLLAPCQLL